MALKAGAQNYEQNFTCGNPVTSCKGFLSISGVITCVNCDNGLKVQGSQCVSGGKSIANCKYIWTHGDSPSCALCNEGYFTSDGICARSSQYLGTGDINPFYRSGYSCDISWTHQGFEVVGNDFQTICQAPSGYTPAPAPEKVKNFCTPGKCAACLRIGDHYTCSKCFDSQITLAETIDGNSFFRCEGTDTGIANCSVLISMYEDDSGGNTGCFMCKPGY